MPADFCLAGQKIHSPIHTHRDIKQALRLLDDCYKMRGEFHLVKLPPLCLKIRKLRLIRTHSIHLLSGPAADTHLQRHLLAQMKVGVPAEPAPVGAAQPCRALGKSGTALSRPDASAGGRSAQRRRVRRLSACHMPAPPFPAIKEARRFSAGTPPNKVSIAKKQRMWGR